MRSVFLPGLLAATLLSSSLSAQQAQFDVVIANGTIVDGTGAARFRGDVAIKDGRVVRIERGSIRAFQRASIAWMFPIPASTD